MDVTARPFSKPAQYRAAMKNALAELAGACPALPRRCFLSGTMPVSVQEFGGQIVSIDIDLRTKRVHGPIKETVMALKTALGARLKTHEVDWEFGIYRGAIRPKEGPTVTVDLFSSGDEEETQGLEPSRAFRGWSRESMAAYVRNKLACLETRAHGKDLFHLACVASLPGMRALVERAMAGVDPMMIARCAADLSAEARNLRRTMLPFGSVNGVTLEQAAQWGATVARREAGQSAASSGPERTNDQIQRGR